MEYNSDAFRAQQWHFVRTKHMHNGKKKETLRSDQPFKKIII